jgi:hypothetical protein
LAGSKSKPKALRMPKAKMWFPNGLPAGTPPAGVIRRTFPAVSPRFCEFAALALSPTANQRLPSGPAASRPPTWNPLPVLARSNSAVCEVPMKLLFRLMRSTWLRATPLTSRVA